MASVTYNPRIFDAADTEAAKRIILTRESGRDTDERWVRETPYLTELICGRLALGPEKLVVDFGCGIGRMAKAMIERAGCRVLGVDLSQDMRGLAPAYVGSGAFSVVSPDVFTRLVDGGLRADAAISVWVLQHCFAPGADIELLARGLTPEGRLLVVNSIHRAVPAVEQRWANDGLDVAALLADRLTVCETGALDAALVGDTVSASSFWGLYAA